MLHMELSAGDTVQVLWEYLIEPDQKDALFRMLADVCAQIRVECPAYEYTLHSDLDNRQRFILCQTWPSREALEQRWQTSDFKALVKVGKPPLKRPMSLIAVSRLMGAVSAVR